MRHERKHAFRWSKRKRKEKETKVKKCVVFVLCFNWMKQTRIPLCSICFVSIQLKHNTSQHITRFQGVKRGVKRNEEKWKACGHSSLTLSLHFSSLHSSIHSTVHLIRLLMKSTFFVSFSFPPIHASFPLFVRHSIVIGGKEERNKEEWWMCALCFSLFLLAYL